MNDELIVVPVIVPLLYQRNKNKNNNNNNNNNNNDHIGNYEYTMTNLDNINNDNNIDNNNNGIVSNDGMIYGF